MIDSPSVAELQLEMRRFAESVVLARHQDEVKAETRRLVQDVVEHIGRGGHWPLSRGEESLAAQIANGERARPRSEPEVVEAIRKANAG